MNLNTAYNIKNFRTDLNQYPDMKYTLWGNGKLLANDFNLRWLHAHIALILNTKGVKPMLPSVESVFDAMERSKHGVVAIGSTDKTIYTLIRRDS